MLFGGVLIIRGPQAHCSVQTVVGPAVLLGWGRGRVLRSGAEGALFNVSECLRCTQRATEC